MEMSYHIKRLGGGVNEVGSLSSFTRKRTPQWDPDIPKKDQLEELRRKHDENMTRLYGRSTPTPSKLPVNQPVDEVLANTELTQLVKIQYYDRWCFCTKAMHVVNKEHIIDEINALAQDDSQYMRYPDFKNPNLGRTVFKQFRLETAAKIKTRFPLVVQQRTNSQLKFTEEEIESKLHQPPPSQTRRSWLSWRKGGRTKRRHNRRRKKDRLKAAS
jgi:hypothetical protein